MKAFFPILLALLLPASPCAAIPNSVFGPIVSADSPLNGEDLDEIVLAAAVWEEGGELPGKWIDEGQIGTSSLSYLLARPKLFGQEVLMLRSTRREGKLAQLEATFVDAGSYFGYFDEKLPEGLSRRQLEEEMTKRLAEKQESFSEGYTAVLSALRETLPEGADKPRPKLRRFGKGRMLRTEPEEWIKDGLAIRLFTAEDRLIRVTLAPEEDAADGWMEAGLEKESERERLERLEASVRKEGSVVHIDGIKTVPQGFKPYCGLNTLAMAARHFGMTLDEDWMAAAAGFQNTGSAGGSNMVKLYHAVAAEAGLSLDRSSKFNEATVKRSLDSGIPVVVWRRFSHERNRLHDRIARSPDADLPDPAKADERALWPDDEAPLHASVITGYDSAKNELFFLESWSGHDRTRRMRIEEMAATTYLCFAFKP
ncbi:C39 family peptidase [Haloferula sp.]|uniref:C39 family peptidase n=1 Tax=Haloferula sp. TaxID=2497595 RepID=UPI00329D6CA0